MAEIDGDIASKAIGEVDRFNLMAQDIVDLVYKNQLDSLRDTLDRFHIPEYYYSVMREKDEMSCIIYTDGKWNVFFSERGQRTNLRETGEISDACYMLIHDLAEDESEYRQMVEYFRHQMDERNVLQPTSAEVYHAIQAGFARLESVEVL